MEQTHCKLSKTRKYDCKGDSDVEYCNEVNCTALVKEYHFKKFGKREFERIGGGSTPEQYGLPENAKELQDLIEDRNMNFAIGNIFKACYRLGLKNKPQYDLNKILYFAERELKRLAKVN